MWPLNRVSPREVLRLGHLAAERWTDGPEGLTLSSSQPLLPPSKALAQLPSSIEALFAGAQASSVTVVLESAWVPVMLAETGASVWRRAEVEALLRHRLALLHDDPADPVGEWDVRVDHRAGEPLALGYGFSPRLRNALDQAARTLGREWSALVPAWAWGWQRSHPQRHWGQKDGHWSWQEQDRTLLGSFRAGRLVAFDAACEPCESGEPLAQALAVHKLRHGLQAFTWPLASSGWQVQA